MGALFAVLVQWRKTHQQLQEYKVAVQVLAQYTCALEDQTNYQRYSKQGVVPTVASPSHPKEFN